MALNPRVILDTEKFQFTIDRLCWEIIEAHTDIKKVALIGVQPRGVHLSNRIFARLKELTGSDQITYGYIDVAFYRDDYRRRDTLITASATNIKFSLEGKQVLLFDDVLYTGRTIRAALDALLDFGRPDKVELLTLIDRRFSRDFPIQADYVGKTVDAIVDEVVKVEWKETDGEDKVWILKADKK